MEYQIYIYRYIKTEDDIAEANGIKVTTKLQSKQLYLTSSHVK